MGALLVGQVLVLVICSYNVGRLFQSVLRLPAITGYILIGLLVLLFFFFFFFFFFSLQKKNKQKIGILCGPNVFALIGSDGGLVNLRKLEQGCLSVIGFAAGTELVLKELQGQAKAIILTVGCIIPTVGAVLYLVCKYNISSVSLFTSYSVEERDAACLIMSTILLARSPASALAVVKELKADGVFTRLCLSASIALDTAVVSLFAINTNVAKIIVDGARVTPSLMLQPFVKLLVSAIVGYTFSHLTSRYIDAINSLQVTFERKALWRSIGVFCIGVLVFFLSDTLREAKYYVVIDALLTCVFCGVCFANAKSSQEKFIAAVDEMLPWTNIPFFTLVGAGISFTDIPQLAPIVMMLLAARLIALYGSSWLSGYLAGLPSEQRHIRWMGFVTQAGVAIGLCKQISLEFPTWGKAVQSLCVSCIVVNLLCGPVCFKWVLNRVGEIPPNSEHMSYVVGPGPPAWPTPKHTGAQQTNTIVEISVIED